MVIFYVLIVYNIGRDEIRKVQMNSLMEDLGFAAGVEDEYVDDSKPLDTDLIIEDANVIDNPYLNSQGLSIGIPIPDESEFAEQVAALQVDPGDGIDPADFKGLANSAATTTTPVAAKAKKAAVPAGEPMFDSKATTLEAFLAELKGLPATMKVKLSPISSNTEALRSGKRRVVGDLCRHKTFVPHITNGKISKNGSTWCVNAGETAILTDVFNYFSEDKTSSDPGKKVSGKSTATVVPAPTAAQLATVQSAPLPDLEEDYLESVDESQVVTVVYPDNSFSPPDLSKELSPPEFDDLI